jgi:Anti-sigma factor NepR
MPQARSQIVERLKSALHAQYDAILNEPLPERWVDLIHRLNDQERMEREEAKRTAPAGRVRPS